MVPGAVVARLARAAVTLACAFVACFLLLHAMPGDPLDRLDSVAAPAAQLERTRRALGLDRPLGGQLAQTLLSYASGDLGLSFHHRRPVAEILGRALPATALLGASALACGYGLGVPLAMVLLGLRPGLRRMLDRLLMWIAVAPRFWFGLLLVLALHRLAGWFPASHAGPPGGGTWTDTARHLVLPGLTLGLPAACLVARFQLAVLSRALNEPHVRAARARGAHGWKLLLHHVLRPSLGPVIALLGIDLPVLASGAIVVELLFAWPGIGRLTVEAVLGADYPLALGTAVLSCAVVLLGRLLAETLEWLVDPRSRGRLPGHIA